MQNPTGGSIRLIGGHELSPEAFDYGDIRLLIRNGERGWHGGLISVCLWEAPEGFPWKPALARRNATIDPAAGEKSVVFLGLRPGRYAVTAFAGGHAKGRLPRTLLGWPAAPVFLPGHLPWRRIMRFEDYAQSVTQSTIVELKRAHAELSFGGINNGDKNNEYTRRSGQNADLDRPARRPAASAHRR